MKEFASRTSRLITNLVFLPKHPIIEKQKKLEKKADRELLLMIAREEPRAAVSAKVVSNPCSSEFCEVVTSDVIGAISMIVSGSIVGQTRTHTQ